MAGASVDSATDRVRDLVDADPVVMIEIAGAIANEAGQWPPDSITDIVGDRAPRILDVDKLRLRAAMEHVLMGREVDNALEWLQTTGLVRLLFPELEATVDLVQETGRQHKDVWAHTKQVVRQTVRRPLVRWAALLHDIGKVPTRTFTPEGVHFHGHAEVGARMFDKVHARFAFPRDERQAVRFLVKHHLRTNQYSEQWTDSAVRRFHREMGPHMVDLLDLSRADITSKRPGRRKQLLEQISALSDRVDRLAEADAKLPPLPGGVGNAIMTAFELRPSRLIGDLKLALERAIDDGSLQPRREDAYYVAYLARQALVPGVAPERAAALIEAGGLIGEAAADADAREAVGDLEGPHRGADPDDPTPGVLSCGHDPENDPCVHRDADPDDPALRR
ncbi:MAG: HD domain-containing protein [Deltaproteobacteria bacterium]|nr:HD domain-containing protein [Deltaproteobacteria bacterium]